MNKIRITIIAILVIAAIFFSGCASLSSTSGQPPVSSTIDTEFDHLLLSPEDLPHGFVRAVEGPMPASAITETMRNFGWQKGHKALYADAIPLTDKSRVMEQDIMIFPGANASVMLDEHQKSFAGINSNDIAALMLPDPDIGDKSFAVKVTSTGATGAETYHYVIGFVKSGTYEVFSMEGIPATYPSLVHAADQAAKKAR